MSTLIAPPDLLSNLLILAPFLLLFEISILMSAVAHKRLNERRAAWEADAMKPV